MIGEATVALRYPTLDVSLRCIRHNLARGIDASMPSLSSLRCLARMIRDVSQRFDSINQKREMPTGTQFLRWEDHTDRSVIKPKVSACKL